MWKFFWRTVQNIIDTLLPSRASRLVAQIAISLTIGIWTLPLWWEPLMKSSIPDNQISTWRYTVIPYILFFAMMLIHILVIRQKNSSAVLLPWKFHDKVILNIGTYHDVPTKKGEKFIRITLKDISQKDMPPPYESPDSVPKEIKTEVATIGFTPGFFFYHGYRVKKIYDTSFSNEDRFYMCKNEDNEESHSVFFFKTQHVTDGEYFFRCFIDHINPEKKEVELDIFFIWLNNPIKP